MPDTTNLDSVAIISLLCFNREVVENGVGNVPIVLQPKIRCRILIEKVGWISTEYFSESGRGCDLAS